MRLTTNAILLAWLVALLVAATVVFSVAFERQHRLTARLVGSDALFLGTSLTRFALPDYAAPKPIPSMGAEFALRIGLSSGSESEVLTLTSAAVESQVKLVFVEVNPIVSRFANDTSRCNAWDTLLNSSSALRRSGIAALRNRDISEKGAEKVENSGPRSINFDMLDKVYPLKIGMPCHLETWRQLANTSQDTQIVLIEMPRSKFARKYIGTGEMKKFHRVAKIFSDQIGLPLFSPDATGSWDDKFFVDRAHMNRRGGDRFIRELAAWWATHQ